MVGRIAKFRKLTFMERMLLLEALVLHLWIGLLLKVIPFRWIPRLFSDVRNSRHVATGVNELSGQIKLATKRAGYVSPWKNKCLVSSLAARCMLRRRKISSSLSLGVTKNSKNMLIAHAWLETLGIELVEKDGDYSELITF